MLKAVVPITVLMACFATAALAEGESSEVRTIIGGGTAQGAALGSPWVLRQSYGASLMRLSESGQGFGARVSLLPSPDSPGAWDASADAVFRVANDSPWYFKGLGGVSVALPSEVWAPRLRAGVEVGLTAIRGGIGLEAGLSVIDSFPPSRPLEGQVVVSLGMGLLFGFGAPPPHPGALCQEERPVAQPARLRLVSASTSPEQGATLSSAMGRALGEEPPGEELRVSETRLYGLEVLYAQYRRYVSTLATSAVSVSAPRGVGVSLGVQPALSNMQAELDTECIKAGFADGLAGFEESLHSYESAFERATVALAHAQLTRYERFLASQEQRYRNPSETQALHQAVAETQALAGYEDAERIRSQHLAGLILTPGEMAEQSDWVGQRRTVLARAEAALGSLARAHPLVAEADFPRELLARASKQDVQSVLLEHLSARKKDIADTRAHLEATPEMVYGLDLLLQESFRAQGIERGTLYEQLLQDHLRDLALAESLPRVTLAAVAVAAGLATGGGGAMAVLAVGTTGALGTYQAVEELQRYQLQSSAYGARLSSQEPTLAWAIVAVLGAGVDAAAFASVLPKLRPALEAFNVGPEAGNLLALERRLAKFTEVEASLKQTLLRAAGAEVEARAAWRALLLPKAPLRAVLTPGAEEFGRLLHAVYLTSKHGLRKFHLFVKTNEAVALLGDVNRLGAGELAALKRGYLAAVKQLETVAAHGKALGMSDRELSAFMELRFKAKGVRVAEVMTELDAWKAAAGATRLGEPGAWVPEAGVVGEARRYQVQQTGHPPGFAYRVPLPSAKSGRVLFDGFDGVNLIECKGPGYEQLLDPKEPGRFKWFFERTQINDPGGMLDQARRQVEAARGIPVRWYVAESKVAEAIRKLFKANKLKQVEVTFVPLQP